MFHKTENLIKFSTYFECSNTLYNSLITNYTITVNKYKDFNSSSL